MYASLIYYVTQKNWVQSILGYNTPSSDKGHTYKITKQFEKTKGVKCQAVSTLDDALYTHCGEAYNKIIKPFEITGQ